MNVSDSIQGRGGQLSYQQQVAQPSNRNGGSTSSASAPTTKQARLDALKIQMQSGQPVDLQSLADSMLKKGAFIDTQA